MIEYKSPITMAIETAYKEIKDKEENAILEAVQKVGITVDKNELIKALKYDRDQYNAGFSIGFSKGYEKAINDVAHYLDREKGFCGLGLMTAKHFGVEVEE